DEWIASLETAYDSALDGVRIDENEIIEPKGFVNFYPIAHPDGDRIFYLSNRGKDTYRAALHERNLTTGDVELVYESDLIDVEHTHTLSCGHSLELKLRPDNTAFDISADGNDIVFSQVRLNRYGETYRDLHIMSLDDNKSIRRLTNSARLH